MKAYQMTSKQVRSFRKNTKAEMDGIEYHLCIDGGAYFGAHGIDYIAPPPSDSCSQHHRVLAVSQTARGLVLNLEHLPI